MEPVLEILEPVWRIMRACFRNLKAHLRRFLGEDSLNTMIPEFFLKIS